MFCIKCGKTLEPTTRVCPDCGTKVVLPEGFVPKDETVVSVDVDMLTGEKTVAADYEALARKAAAASAQPAKPEAPKFSTGFDLNSAKKIMNGRSILIDDSPAPAFAVAPAPIQNDESTKPSGKKYIVIIIAAIAVITITLGAVFFFVSGKNADNEKGDESSEKITAAETAEETSIAPEKLTQEYFTTEYFEEETTLGNISQEIATESSGKVTKPFPTSDKLNNIVKGDKETQNTTEAKTDDIIDLTEKQEEKEPVSEETSTVTLTPNEPQIAVTLPDIPDIITP